MATRIKRQKRARTLQSVTSTRWPPTGRVGVTDTMTVSSIMAAAKFIFQNKESHADRSRTTLAVDADVTGVTLQPEKPSASGPFSHLFVELRRDEEKRGGRQPAKSWTKMKEKRRYLHEQPPSTSAESARARGQGEKKMNDSSNECLPMHHFVFSPLLSVFVLCLSRRAHTSSLAA